MNKRERIATIKAWNQWYHRKIRPKKKLPPFKYEMVMQLPMPVIYHPQQIVCITNLA